MEKLRTNDKVLEVKNLRISFRTNTGTVKAVRGIDFALRKGKTLAIVGESGSGKSVTSKAILGILANNKIVEDGQIIYDGKDLLKLNEEQFTKIRGVKISMIFQDPLSSLNPIMKVGKQLTEAMYLKAKATRKEAFKYLVKVNKVLLTECEKENINEINAMIKEINNMKLGFDFNALVESHKHLFVDAINKSIEKQKDAIKVALATINNFKDTELVDENSFNPNKIKIEAKKIGLELKKAVFNLQIEADDIIEVYESSLEFYVKSYEEAIKQTEERRILLEKHNVKSVYDLPAEIRVGLKEVIVDKSVYFKDIVDSTNQLIEHLNFILNDKEFIADNIVNDLMKYYVEQIIASKTILTKEETKKRAITLLEEVGINDPERRFNQYPFEFSGGMRQRIVIAIALSSNPEVLICDEPTTALDVTIQAQILELINKLKAEKNLSIIFITHDLGVVANMADDIAVMYAGKIVEYGTVYDIFYDPRHPYTWALLGSMPDLDTKEKLDAIPGTPPNMLLPPKGDAFASRNKYALEIDYEAQPPFFKVSDTHYAATWLLDEYAPEVEAPKIVKQRIINSLKKNSSNKPSYTLEKNSILNHLGGKEDE